MATKRIRKTKPNPTQAKETKTKIKIKAKPKARKLVEAPDTKTKTKTTAQMPPGPRPRRPGRPGQACRGSGDQSQGHRAKTRAGRRNQDVQAQTSGNASGRGSEA